MWPLYRRFSGCYACAHIFPMHGFDSNVICVLHSLSSACTLKASRCRLRMVEIATNPQGYHVHVGEVLKHYTPEKNQATPARYHISGYNFNLGISLFYGTVIGMNCQHSDRIFQQSILWYSCIIGLRGGQPILCRCRLMTHAHFCTSQLPFWHTSMCGDAPGLISSASAIIPESHHCLGRDWSFWPGSA